MDYQLSPEDWNQGFMTEAARAVIQYGFAVLKLAKIVVFTWPENRRSIRVVEKLGFTQVGKCGDEGGHACNLYVLLHER
jgi:[ribosomal protein S5]-alanine N-acetyltransferase